MYVVGTVVSVSHGFPKRDARARDKVEVGVDGNEENRKKKRIVWTR